MHCWCVGKGKGALLPCLVPAFLGWSWPLLHNTRPPASRPLPDLEWPLISRNRTGARQRQTLESRHTTTTGGSQRHATLPAGRPVAIVLCRAGHLPPGQSPSTTLFPHLVHDTRARATCSRQFLRKHPNGHTTRKSLIDLISGPREPAASGWARHTVLRGTLWGGGTASLETSHDTGAHSPPTPPLPHQYLHTHSRDARRPRLGSQQGPVPGGEFAGQPVRVVPLYLVLCISCAQAAAVTLHSVMAPCRLLMHQVLLHALCETA